MVLSISFRRIARCGLAFVALTLTVTLDACSTTRFHERQRLAHECMELDPDESVSYLRTKMEAAREGAFGRFGPVAAGGCGCQ